MREINLLLCLSGGFVKENCMTTLMMTLSEMEEEEEEKENAVEKEGYKGEEGGN